MSHVESIRSGVAGDGEGTEQFHVNRLATTTSDPPARTSAYRARLIFSWGKVKTDGSGRQGRLRPAGARFFVTLPGHADASRVDTRGRRRPSDGGPTRRRSWHTQHCTSGGVRLCLDRSPRSAAFRSSGRGYTEASLTTKFYKLKYFTAICPKHHFLLVVQLGITITWLGHGYIWFTNP